MDQKSKKAERPLWYRLGPNHEVIEDGDTPTCFNQDKKVAKTEIRAPNRLLWLLGFVPDYMVSTVFLGLDHQYGDGPPLVFETMVFRKWVGWKSWLSLPGGKLVVKPAWYLRPLYRPNPLGNMTMWIPLFRNWSEWSEQDCERYSTWDEAIEGHRKMVAKWLIKSGT